MPRQSHHTRERQRNRNHRKHRTLQRSLSPIQPIQKPSTHTKHKQQPRRQSHAKQSSMQTLPQPTHPMQLYRVPCRRSQKAMLHTTKQNTMHSLKQKSTQQKTTPSMQNTRQTTTRTRHKHMHSKRRLRSTIRQHSSQIPQPQQQNPHPPPIIHQIRTNMQQQHPAQLNQVHSIQQRTTRLIRRGQQTRIPLSRRPIQKSLSRKRHLTRQTTRITKTQQPNQHTNLLRQHPSRSTRSRNRIHRHTTFQRRRRRRRTVRQPSQKHIHRQKNRAIQHRKARMRQRPRRVLFQKRKTTRHTAKIPPSQTSTRRKRRHMRQTTGAQLRHQYKHNQPTQHRQEYTMPRAPQNQFHNRPQRPTLLRPVHMPATRAKRNHTKRNLTTQSQQRLPRSHPHVQHNRAHPQQTQRPRSRHLQFPPQPKRPSSIAPSNQRVPQGTSPLSKLNVVACPPNPPRASGARITRNGVPDRVKIPNHASRSRNARGRPTVQSTPHRTRRSRR